MRGGMGVIWLEPQLGKGMGRGPTSPPPTRESERRGAAPSRRATWDPRVPAWAPTGRAHGSPARNWGEEGGRRRRRREGGDRTCLISPQAPRAPHPRGTGRKGKREGGRGGRTRGFPQPRGEELTLRGLDSQPLALWGPPPPPAFRTRSSSPRAWHPRGTSSPRLCGSHPPTSPPAARLRTQPTPFQPAAWGLAAPGRHRFSPLHPPPQARLSHAGLPSLGNPPSHDPVFQASWGLASSPGWLPARPSAKRSGHLPAHPWHPLGSQLSR